MVPSNTTEHLRGLPVPARVLLALGLLLSVLSSEALAVQGGSQLKAGAATSNITPPLDLKSPIAGVWSSPPGTYIHDDLQVRCLVLDNGQTRVALLVADNIGLPRYVLAEAKRRAELRTGLRTDHILVSSTHTHSAASARGKDWMADEGTLDGYQNFVADRIVDAIVQSIHNLEPARVGWGKGILPEEVFNRRWVMKPGTPLPNPFEGTDRVRMNPGVGNPDILEPAGPTDPEICFVSVQSTEGRPIALLANYSLHYVGGVPQGHVSADYFAVFSRRIAELLGADRLNLPFVAMMSNGTSGNINNINYRGGQPKLPPYGRMNLVANKVAAEVFRAYQDIQYQHWVPLGMLQTDLPLVMRQPTAEQLERARKIMANPEAYPREARPSPRAVVSYAESTIRMSQYPRQISIPLQAIRIGDLAITTIPFETFVETGLEIKKKSPFQQTFTISSANGSYGYLPTPEHHKLGGYETWLGTSRVEVEASTKISQRLLEMLREYR